MEHGVHVMLKAEHLFSVFGFPVTNSLLMTWIVMALLALFAVILGSKLSLIPGKVQAGVEWLFQGALDYMTEVFESESLARKYFPLICTIFLFVFLGNELAFLPGIGSIGFLEHGELVPFLRTPAADLNFTLALAVIAFLVIEISGIVVLGTLKHFSKYINFSSPINFVVGIIEMVSNIGRLISFSFRLFGNIFAGEVMILVVTFLAAYIVPVPVLLFEVFVGFVQAIVFSMLTLFFIKLSVAEPHGEEAH